MKHLHLLLTFLSVLLCACGKEDPPGPAWDPSTYTPSNPYPPSVYKYGLRELGKANGVMIGAEFTRGEYADDSLRVVLKRDFEAVTFGNEMKHDAIVQGDGKLLFYWADEMVGWAGQCGLKLFGHTLAWHSQQQCDYLQPLINGAPDAATAAARVREAHAKWVDGMVEHFDVYGWDVVNEELTDYGEWRNATNTPSGYHVFLWGDYYSGGTKAFVDQAFHSASEALKQHGKTADLYINDYNLEWSEAKLEAICKYAEGNPEVTGVGSQMHVNTDVNREGITKMLQRMVKTGKKVRISELDIAQGANPDNDQASLVVFIFDQYLTLVPEAQRGGITFWGVSDKHSWLGAAKQPLLFNTVYGRKAAYLQLHAYLLKRAGLE